MKFLSIIVPFHNSELKCLRLLETLRCCDDPEVEIICVDDGSTDDTPVVLEHFRAESQCTVQVIRQPNKGPGGARNTGLEASSGKYIWFVDSDDGVRLGAVLEKLRTSVPLELDFIDFDIETSLGVVNSMEISAGCYELDESLTLLMNKFGHIWSKIFHRRVFFDSGVRYPEFCIYEDDPLHFILPFFINRFEKSDIAGCIHHRDFDSITRGERSNKHFDRLMTIAWGYHVGISLTERDEVLALMKSLFIEGYLSHTISLTRLPSKAWIEALRVMRQLRSDADALEVNLSISYLLNERKGDGLSWKFKSLFVLFWFVSRAMPSQQAHFDSLRLKAWGQPFRPPTITAIRAK